MTEAAEEKCFTRLLAMQSKNVNDPRIVDEMNSASAMYHKDEKLLVTWYRRAIARGLAVCVCGLAEYLEHQKDSQDEVESLYQRACEMGYTDAMASYGGWLAEHGSRAAARALWLRGAAQGNQLCIVNINRMLEYQFSMKFARLAAPYLNLANQFRMAAIEDNVLYGEK